MRNFSLTTVVLLLFTLLTSCNDPHVSEVRERPINTKHLEKVNSITVPIDRKDEIRVTVPIDRKDEIRVWNLTSGTEVKGSYLYYEKDHIFIKMNNKQKGKIHFDALSEADRHHIQFLEKENSVFRDELIARERKNDFVNNPKPQFPPKPPIKKPPLNGSKIKVMIFFADWFPPCKKMMPHVKEFERKHSDIILEPVNIDHEKALAKEMQIEKIPTLIFFKNGNEIKRVVGFRTYIQLKEILLQLR